MNLLKKRIIKKRRQPPFHRQEWFKYVRLGIKWRRPTGRKSKLRTHKKQKGFIPSAGYGSDSRVKFMHPCGLNEVIVFNIPQLAGIDSKKECARIAGSVGTKKRIEIARICKEKNIKILNPQRCERKIKLSRKKQKIEEAKPDEVKEEKKPARKNKIEKKEHDSSKPDFNTETKTEKTKEEVKKVL